MRVPAGAYDESPAMNLGVSVSGYKKLYSSNHGNIIQEQAHHNHLFTLKENKKRLVLKEGW
jgi:hypothetical protein